METPLKTRTTVSWGLPALTWLASLVALGAGIWIDSSLFAIAFILAATGVLITVMAFGSATAVMDVPTLAVPKAASADFFPKGAISFFLALIAFFGASWLALYALMIHHGHNL